MGASFRQDFLTTPDGARIYYQVQGEGSVALAFCDGLGCDGFAWKYLLPILGERYTLLRWHYRGHGRSPVPSQRELIGMHHTCEDLARVMDAANIPSAVVFGHSMGVQVALEFHRRFGSRVRGLALLCGSYGNPLDTWHDHTMLRAVFPRLRDLVERFPSQSKRVTSVLMKLETTLELAVRTELNPDLIQREDMVPYFDHLAAMEPVAFVRTLDSLKDHSAWEHLPYVQVPTLIVGGERDRFTPVWLSRRMAEAITGSELLLVPGGSHTAPLERPGLINRAVSAFLRRHFAP
ncbi:MAG: alpha/beta fold hydrolase [Myxococcota bacterium]